MKNEDLAHASFAESDLRGADFSGADLSGADFSHSKIGIAPLNLALILLVSFLVSLLSGYVAVLASQTVHDLIKSQDINLRIAGVSATVILISFIVFAYLRGVGNATRSFMLPAVGVVMVIGLVIIVLGKGTGEGVLYVLLACVLVVIMFVVGTIARAAAGSLSNILFIVVALSGGFFSKTIGGGIGPLIMAISCAMISKKALKGAKGFESLRKISFYISRKFGTSFRNSRLAGANFQDTEIHNADFTGADVSMVRWDKSKKINCITIESQTANERRT